MFSLTFVAASLVLAHLSAASAVPSLAKRAPGLSIVLSGPAGVQTSPSTVIVGAVVTNTGTVPLRVLKMNTVLSTDKTSPFIVTRTGAVPVAFTGTRNSVSLSDLPASQFQSIAVGATLPIVNHALADLYALGGSGTTTIFTVNAKTQFLVIQEGITKPFLVTATSNTITISVAFTRRRSISDRAANATVVEKRAVNGCTNIQKKAVIDAAYADAKSLSTGAAQYMTSRGASDPLYASYFGTTAVNVASVGFTTIAAENDNTIDITCESDPRTACTDGVLGYVNAATNDIHYCTLFFTRAVPTADLCKTGPGAALVANRNSYGGIGITASGHTQATSEDYSYGCSLDQALATSSAAQALVNSDTYQCFATQVYVNTVCN